MVPEAKPSKAVGHRGKQQLDQPAVSHLGAAAQPMPMHSRHTRTAFISTVSASPSRAPAAIVSAAARQPQPGGAAEDFHHPALRGPGASLRSSGNRSIPAASSCPCPRPRWAAPQIAVLIDKKGGGDAVICSWYIAQHQVVGDQGGMRRSSPSRKGAGPSISLRLRTGAVLFVTGVAQDAQDADLPRVFPSSARSDAASRTHRGRTRRPEVEHQRHALQAGRVKAARKDPGSPW